MELTPEIRERLKEIMNSNNDTGYTLNKKLGISATTIGNYLNGKITKADNTKLKAMCDLWGIDLLWLETGQDMVQSPKVPISNTESVKGTTEQILQQIYLEIKARNDQFTYIRKENGVIHEEFDKLKKELNRLTQEIKTMIQEIQKLKEQEE